MASKLGNVVSGFFRRVIDSNDKKLGQAATKWQADTVLGWPVDTGFSRASIEPPRRVSKGHWQFSITAAYAGVIEYGGYRGVGPKTAQQSGEQLGDDVTINPGIYPIQRPSAPLRRALVKTKREMRETYGKDVFQASIR